MRSNRGGPVRPRKPKPDLDAEAAALDLTDEDPEASRTGLTRPDETFADALLSALLRITTLMRPLVVTHRRRGGRP